MNSSLWEILLRQGCSKRLQKIETGYKKFITQEDLCWYFWKYNSASRANGLIKDDPVWNLIRSFKSKPHEKDYFSIVDRNPDNHDLIVDCNFNKWDFFDDKTLILIDDCITTGSTYIATKRILSVKCGDLVKIVGLFLGST